MKLNVIATMMLASAGLLMTGCGSDSNGSNSSGSTAQTPPTDSTGSNPPPTEGTAPPQTEGSNPPQTGGTTPPQTDGNTPIEEGTTPLNGVAQLKITDVNHLAITNAELQILPATEWRSDVNSAGNQPSGLIDQTLFLQYDQLPTLQDFAKAKQFKTDKFGISSSVNLAPGTYYLLVKKNNKSVITALLIHPTNTNKNLELNVPLSCESAACTSVETVENAIIGTLVGQVLTQGQPLENAQVSFSGGASTNGAFVTALTDENGYFTLAFNVSADFSEVLKNATLMISAPGYATFTKQVAITASISAGRQFELSPNTETVKSIWRETFEVDSSTRNAWTVTSAFDEVKWSLLQKDHNIQNKDSDRLTFLAPNDETDGKVPNPPQGNYAYWYGNTVAGNYLGKELTYDYTNADGEPIELANFDGGTSIQPNYGALTSPAIDLSSAQKPLSLSFKTWWEIESVNPSSRGYDTMDIEVSVGGGEFKKLARLNPLSDPQTDYNRSPIPFSNFGFNLAPQFSQQEGISLDEYAGKSDVRIRFNFNTIDNYYNAFRGWVVDDIVIQNSPSTFPLFESKSEANTEAASFTIMNKAVRTLIQSAPTYRWLVNPPKRTH